MISLLHYELCTMKFIIFYNAGKRNNSALGDVYLVYSSKSSVTDTKRDYETNYCRCAPKYGVPSWCGKWSTEIKDSFCVMNGGFQSKHCPGAIRIVGLNDYFSSHPSVCNKSERKLSYC